MPRFLLLLLLLVLSWSTPNFAQRAFTSMNAPFPPQMQTATDAQMQMNLNPPKNRLATARGVWQAIVRFMGLPNSWAKKQTFQEGVKLGNNPTPTAGDLWYYKDFWVQTSDGAARILTSRTGGGLGTVAYVSTAGNDDTGAVGSVLYPFKNPQAAINALPAGGTLHFLPGEHTANVALAKPLCIILENAQVRGSWDMRNFSSQQNLYFIGIGTAGLSSDEHLFDGFAGYLGDVVLDNLQIRCTKTCFRRASNESGFVHLKKTDVSAGTFMEGSFHGGGARDSIIKTSQGRGFAMMGRHNKLYLRNTLMETQGACLQSVGGNEPVGFDIAGSTLISHSGWCAQASDYAGGFCQSFAMDSQFLAMGTYSALMGFGNSTTVGGDLSLERVKLVNTQNLPNVAGFLGTTEFFYTLGNRTLPAATSSFASQGNQSITLLPRIPLMV